MKHVILASVSVLAMAAAPARAQSSEAQPEPASAAENSSVQDAAKPTNEDGLGEIIVTAQRTTENAQKAPVAINVLKPEELIRQNVTRAEDLTRVVPALVATASGGPNTSFFVRGVGNTTANSYSDPAISFNYDGVYIGRPNATQGFFFDLQRIEVLKGPQGTLYGRNATGGAINVIPNRPVLGQTGGEAMVGYGNYDALQAQAAVNLAIGDNHAVRLAGSYSAHDGYLSDGTADQKSFSLRGQWLHELSPELTNRMAVDYSHQGGNGTGSFVYGTYVFSAPLNRYVFTPTPQLGPKIGVHDPLTEAFVQTRNINQVGRTSEATGTYPSQDNFVWGATNETVWKTDAGTLTVQAGYRESKVDSLSTTSNFRGFKIDEQSDQFTLEARFAGKLGRSIDYLVGAFYFDESIANHSVINQIVTSPVQDYDTGTRSIAGFGRLSFHPTDALTFTVGGRYTDDKKYMDGLSNVFTLNCGNPNAPPGPDSCPTLPLIPLFTSAQQIIDFYTANGVITPTNPLNAAPVFNRARVLNNQIRIDSTLKTKKFTYRLAADWELTPRNMVYASVETGFHGGGFNFGKGLETYDPEYIKAFTIGSKNRFFGNKLQLNIEGFYWKYKDQQISQFGNDFSTPTPISVFYTSNIGRSVIQGFDADMAWLVTPTTRISGSVQYLDTEYKSYTVGASARGPRPNFNTDACDITGGVIVVPADPTQDIPYNIDCSGSRALFSPKWSFNVGAEQTINIGEFKLIATAGTRWRGDFFAATSYQPWVISKAAYQSDASLTFAPQSDRWFVTAFVNNIENKRRITQSNVNATLLTQSAVSTAPRTYGVRVGGRF